MARPKKNTIDYFPHPVKDGSRMYIMEQKYGDKGYCCYYKLLQQLGGAENHYLDFNGIKDRLFFAALIRCTEDEVFEMLDTLSEIGTIDPELWSKKIIWCQELVDSIAEVYSNRKRKLPEKPVSTSRNTTQEEVSTDENPQSKVKESKVNKSKEEYLLKNQFFFKINSEVFYEKVSDHFLEHHGIFYEAWEMKNSKKVAAAIFEIMDLDYNGYDFTNENHIRNTFKKIHEKLKTNTHGKPTNQTGPTAVINPNKDWDS